MRIAKPGLIEVAFSGSLDSIPLDAQFSVLANGTTAVFGPPGCGNTWVARCIAGAAHLPTGFCAVDGEVWQDEGTFRLPHLRPIGHVFQRPILLSNLSVRGNLLCGAPKSKPSAIELDEVVQLLELAPLLDRSPLFLSAAERQRVAIGNALLCQPRLLLMEEPLAALDHSTKRELLPFLERLHEKLTLPIIYISHDMADIERLADHLVMMKDGVVTAVGPLHVLQSDLALPLAARHEAAVSFDALVSGYDERYGLLVLGFGGARLLVPGEPLTLGAQQRLRIAACDVSVAREIPRASSILNVFPARIKASVLLGGAEVTLLLALEGSGSGTRFLSRITRRSFDALGLEDGMDVFAQVTGLSLVSSSETLLKD
ncbi:molybdenum ABC transporter ATP-binding protein [Bradyrhizobium sp. 4]|uniref:molybdenum ABC transporter ATP-binding protein n=1 Tax=unclassified Bradyrhizobium TaxID=2631580 RepID=UPI001FF9CC76|nr:MULTISPECIES: molybdenum ABC transporter ATP-binding protein [unclassified Bradyrhizobium]MCK1400305.1 molybdenum ABC transporter ATP-binding protein [Bradyrhizobium sp. 39]MCK1752232.1 molybdenum ABC transporter ATP-binding protein [Bradyrhizobium sp. 135]UPJ36418.1 molybdenum ABC transporter ATP-binding protein [Bradyrhizobium sp. 4]